MRRMLFLGSLFVILAMAAFGQVTGGVISTSTLDGARYEIIQPPTDKVTTLRLDKFTGAVHRLANCPKDDTVGSNKCWKEMEVVDLQKTSYTAKIHYQIVVNSLLNTIFLMQIETGKTWQYGVDPLEKWHPFIECNDQTNNNCFWRRN